MKVIEILKLNKGMLKTRRAWCSWWTRRTFPPTWVLTI